MSTFLTIILTITTLMMSLFAPLNKVEAPKDTSSFEPVIRFAVMSDSHVKTIGSRNTYRIQKALSLAYSDAEQDENYNTLDALLFEGDLTNRGLKSQIIGYYAAVNSVLKDETEFLAVVPKGHDCIANGKSAVSTHEQISGNSSDYHVTVNGYHFIGVSTTKDSGDNYSDEQAQWLDEQLSIATKDDPSKPVFVSTHEHVSDTVYGSLKEDGWGIDNFRDVLCKYPQAVSFSGHSHYPLNDPRSVWQGEFTAIGTSSLHYSEFTVDGKNKIKPDNCEDVAQFWIVELDAQNNMRLRGFDALSGTLQVEYTLSNLSDVNSRQVTPEQQKANSSAPYFEDGAALTVKKVVSQYTVTTPAAKSSDDYSVFLYRFVVYDSDGNVKSSTYQLNNYWLYPEYSSLKQNVSASSGDTIKVWAENSYGMQSEALEYTVK